MQASSWQSSERPEVDEYVAYIEKDLGEAMHRMSIRPLQNHLPENIMEGKKKIWSLPLASSAATAADRGSKALAEKELGIHFTMKF